MSENKPKIKIQFPNLLLIPLISISCIVLKLAGCTDYDWIHVIFSIPFIMYFGWCIGYCLLAVIGMFTIKMISKIKD